VVGWGSHGLGFLVYKMPESARALCRMVSLTAAKTRRMLDVSVAWVRLDGVSLSVARCFAKRIWALGATLTEGIDSNARD